SPGSSSAPCCGSGTATTTESTRPWRATVRLGVIVEGATSPLTRCAHGDPTLALVFFVAILVVVLCCGGVLLHQAFRSAGPPRDHRGEGLSAHRRRHPAPSAAGSASRTRGCEVTPAAQRGPVSAVGACKRFCVEAD